MREPDPIWANSADPIALIVKKYDDDAVGTSRPEDPIWAPSRPDPIIIPRPSDDSDVRPAAPVVQSSFDIVASTTGATPTLTVGRGGVRYAGKYVKIVPQTDVVVTGTSGSPTYITLQTNKTDSDDIAIVALASEYNDNDSYWYDVLYEAYVSDALDLVLFNRRPDIRRGSPI